MPKGVLVAFEGIDGAGKSTQVAALAELFADLGVAVVRTREPTDGPHGRRIRATAQTGRLPPEEELALFVADRKEHVRDLIRPALERGALVLIDRYYYSTAAYQGSRGLDPDEIIRINEAFAPRPDLLVVLDLPAEGGVGRVRSRDVAGDHFERMEDLRRCREIFLSLHGDHVRHVDAARGPDEVGRDIVRAVLAGPYGLGEIADGDPGDPRWREQVRSALGG